MAWAVGKLSHFHQGLLDAMAEHAVSMVKVCRSGLSAALWLLSASSIHCSMGAAAPSMLLTYPVLS